MPENSLFSDHVSMQMAEGKYEGNNHPVSLDVDALPSHLTDQCNCTVLQKGTSFPYMVPGLPACIQLFYRKFEG